MMKNLALLSLVSMLSSSAYAMTPCQEANRINAPCDINLNGKNEGYCNKIDIDGDGEKEWVCQEDEVKLDPAQSDGRSVFDDGTTGGGGTVYEVVECVTERGEFVVETYPLGHSDETCMTLFEFTLDEEEVRLLDEGATKY